MLEFTELMSVYEGLSLPNVIFQTSSKYNEDIKVVESNGVRRLVVNNHTQSLSYNSPQAESMVWGRTLRLLQSEAPELGNVLVLGMGGGTMEHLLANAYPNLLIVSVELDDVMVDIAKKYFEVDKIPNHYIIADDACRLVVEPQLFNLRFESFQALIVDIFIGDAYPDLGKSGNFLAHVCKMVQPGGLVIINRIYLQDHQEDVHDFLENVEMYLHDVKSIIVPGKTNSDNMLIYGRV